MSEKHGRAYRKRRRAELEAETRRRITEATVELHGSIGPARTTVSAIAERAGVQRATVYRHFPDQASLFVACTQHWRDRNPAPDLSSWASIDSPAQRFRAALGELYDWYGRTEQMAELVRRDAATIPAMRPSVRSMGAYFEAAVDVLLRPGARRRIWLVVLPVALYALWAIGYGNDSQIVWDNIPSVPRAVADSIGADLVSLTGRYRLPGVGGGPVFDATYAAVLALPPNAAVNATARSVAGRAWRYRLAVVSCEWPIASLMLTRRAAGPARC